MHGGSILRAWENWKGPLTPENMRQRLRNSRDATLLCVPLPTASTSFVKKHSCKATITIRIRCGFLEQGFIICPCNTVWQLHIASRFQSRSVWTHILDTQCCWRGSPFSAD